ncbi:MAG: D-alanine--D-alanine ligase [Candidatus Zixiibacteriota bacterium]
MENKLNIVILAGGTSAERAVSLTSARAIYEATQRLGYNARVIDSASGKSLLDDSGNYLIKESIDSSSKLVSEMGSSALMASILSDREFLKNTDIVFNALHGGHGENGTIQAILEITGVSYTGSRVMASAIAMNKAFTKMVLINADIPTPNWKLIKCNDPDHLPDFIDEINEQFRFPLIVKPNDSGSTVGLTLVKVYSDLRRSLQICHKESSEILIEEYIKGREITAAVLDNENLPLVEIIPSGELYDYHCKYTKGGSQYICPARIPDSVTEKIKNYALKSYQLIDCSGLARVDFLLNEDNEPYLLEINTLPGMTELSLAPMAAKEAGINFDQLVERICQSALKNDARKNRN